MKFDFNQPLLNLDKTPMKDNAGEVFTMNKVLAQHFGQMTKFNEPVKLMEWCQELWETGIINLDKADQPKFRSAVESFQTAYSYVIGQLLVHFDDIKEGKTKSNKSEAPAAPVTNNNGMSAEPQALEQ